MEPIEVHVDPAVELVSIVFRLASAKEYRQAPATEYRAAVDAHFQGFVTSPAVRLAQELREEHGIGYDAPVGLATRLSAGAALEGADERWEQAGTRSFARALEKFRKETYFDAFFGQQAARTGEVESAWRTWLATHDVRGWFERNVATSEPVSWTIVPGMLVGPNNYGCSVQMPDGSLALRPVIGVSGDVPVITRREESVLVHEFSHGFVNAAWRAQPSLTAPAARVFAMAEAEMSRQADPRADIAMNETGVRALTVLYLRDTYGPLEGELQVEREIALGFRWIEPVVAALEAARAAGPIDLGAVAPAVAASLAAWSDAPERPFRGPINAAMEAEVVLGPADGPLGAYAAAMHEQFWPTLQRMDGATWTPPTPTPTSLVAYGTPADTPLIQNLLAQLGAMVTADHIALPGFSIPGEHLVLVAAFAHPDNPKVSTLLYTAADALDLVDINTVFHGPTDWLITRKLGPEQFAPLASGEFVRTSDGWTTVVDDLPSVQPRGKGGG